MGLFDRIFRRNNNEEESESIIEQVQVVEENTDSETLTEENTTSETLAEPSDVTVLNNEEEQSSE
ncbi:MAG: hypothetical protein LBI13_09050, partial [Streptococcaceae bacterium]|nr:hypothetical protein [Streptococcaceae bacterium]